MTNWITREMCRTIRRRDPTRPSFWFLSYTHPHPPLVPPQHYFDVYQRADVDRPVYGDWTPASWRVGKTHGAEGGPKEAELPYRLKQQYHGWHVRSKEAVRTALAAFYALCTHIDHQMRLVIGTLREEGILDETAILFTADHGDMLGRHGLWAKRLFYEPSANVPMLLVPPQNDPRIEPGTHDGRLVGLMDVMPTLLDLAGSNRPRRATDRRCSATGSASTSTASATRTRWRPA